MNKKRVRHTSARGSHTLAKTNQLGGMNPYLSKMACPCGDKTSATHFSASAVLGAPLTTAIGYSAMTLNWSGTGILVTLSVAVAASVVYTTPASASPKLTLLTTALTLFSCETTFLSTASL